MRVSEGYRKYVYIFKILALGLVMSPPLWAQHMMPLQFPVSEGNQDPVSYMRPHYVIHQPPGAIISSMNTPPSSALNPAVVRHAYGFDQISNQGAGQIIGIVDAYDDPNIEADLAVFNQAFGLPACTTSNGCFRKVYGNGCRPVTNANWSLEMALDVEWAHAIAPRATIVLVEAYTNSLSDLTKAVDVAVRNGASAVSMSWTAGEFAGETKLDNHFVSNGVTFLAASGDYGTGVAYPAASPNVVGVGGTTLSVDSSGNYVNEVAWSGSGGGLSKIEYMPLYQAQFGIPGNPGGRRGAPDVSYNGNPGTGYAVYTSVKFNKASGWFQIGGTSAGTPQWAALIAIANSLRVTARKARLNSTNNALYSVAKSNPGSNYHAVTQGTNGVCGLVCDASDGYDYVTGLGTPQANVIIGVLAIQ